METQEKPAGTAMGRRPQSIGEEFGRVPIRDDPELGTYFLKPPKCHIAIYRFSYWRRDPDLRSIPRDSCDCRFVWRACIRVGCTSG